MSLFSRLSGIVAGNLNALLDRVESPLVISAQILRDMEEGLVEAKRYAAAAIAAERRLARELEQQRLEAQRWQTRAREALGAGRDDLARQALARKQEHEELAASLEAQAATARRLREDLKTALRTVELRIAEARQKQRSILARHRAAQARQELHRVAGAGVASCGSPSIAWERLENQLKDLEDQVAAQEELQPLHCAVERELAELETRQDLDQELEALRRELKGEES